MLLAVIISCAAAAMIGLAIRANQRFKVNARLPMQWSLSGTVNWTAPRMLAVGLIPALGIVTLLAVAALAATMPPRQGQETQVIPAVLLLGAVSIACQLLHLWLVDRTLRSRRG